MQDPSIETAKCKRDGPARKLPLSFEMFPPRSAAGRLALATTIDHLDPVATGGFSVTMGAGGSTRSGTLETSLAIARRSGRSVKAHLIALGQSRANALETADRFWNNGITSILALRGDPPRSGEISCDDGFGHASDLVAALRARHDFKISVAAYPEKHPEARSLEEDIDYLKAKLDAGASEAICQFVLNPVSYARFLDVCSRRGVTAPIVPGLMPIENWPRVRAFAIANGTSVPAELDRLFAELEGSDDASRNVATAVLLKQAQHLAAYGAPALHVYALNKWKLPLALARGLEASIEN